MTYRKTLLLNQGYQPIKAISWKRAICLHILDKVDVLENYKDKISSPSIEFNVPAVIRLRNHANVGPMKIRFSRANIYSRDKKVCQYCGNKFKPQELTLDHVIPKSVGGKTTWTNIVTSCKDCNTVKANRTPQQAGMRLIQRPAYPDIKAMYSDVVGESVPAEWSDWVKVSA